MRRRLATFVVVLVALAGFGSSSAAADPTIVDYFAGNAHLSLYKHLTAADGVLGAGAKVIVQGSTWYLAQWYLDSVQGQNCGGQPALNNVAIGTEIRKSVDAGQTWATHATIVAPTNGTLWACVANDGDLFYNATTQTWSYLAQCLAATGGWRTCVFTRAGADPMGPFTAYGSNGSVPAPSMAALKAICATSARCAADTLGQDFVAIGTYQILGQNGAYYLISFHAGTVSGRTVRFFAVVSSDWQTWFVNQDAFLGSSDASNLFNARWDGGPVGVADGYTLSGSDGLFYTVASAMDHNVGCIEGQHWYIGLWRSSDLVTWQPRAAGAPEVNPIVSSEPDSNPAVTGSDPGCGSSYPAMWVANGTTYFAFTRNSGPMLGFLIYKLAAN